MSLSVKLKQIRRAGVGVESLDVDHIMGKVGEEHGATHKIDRDTERLFPRCDRPTYKIGLRSRRLGLLGRLIYLHGLVHLLISLCRLVIVHVIPVIRISHVIHSLDQK